MRILLAISGNRETRDNPVRFITMCLTEVKKWKCVAEL
jgi:hypothetical protein